MLRFVASRTERSDRRIAAMLDLMLDAAQEFEESGVFRLTAEQVPLAARAFAGVAAFLQKQILPPAVSAGNASGERQIRWAVDTAMASVNSLLTRAATTDDAIAILSLDGTVSR